jgi:hypothetical protein
MSALAFPTADAATMAPGQINRYRGAFRAVDIGRLTGVAFAPTVKRWIGRCRCGTGVRVEGYPVLDSKGDAAVVGADGLVYTTRVLNTHEIVLVRHRCDPIACPQGHLTTDRVSVSEIGGRWVFCRPVFDGGKIESKRHTCGSRCTNATGPACDCKCRGANHGSGH